MATNVKGKKKRGNSENSKLITYGTIGLAAIVLIIVIAVISIELSTNDVGKVQGEKIYDYEYEFYLNKALSDLQAEVDVEGKTEEEKYEIYKKFWSTPDENGVLPEQKAKKNALEDARKFKASYALALEKGFKLTKKEKNTIISNIDYTLDYMLQMYGAYGYTRDNVIAQMCATMSLKEYKKYSICSATVEKYKNNLKEGYSVTDQEIKEIYEKDINKYRKVDVRFLFLANKDEKGEKLSDTKYDELLAKANAIAKAINETGKYEDKDFETYIKANSDDSGTGLVTISSESENSSKKINEYAYARKQEELKDKEFTDCVVIEDEDAGGIYVVRTEKIEDLDNSKTDEKENLTSIKDRIKAERLEELAVKEIEDITKSDKYKVKNTQDKIMQKYIDKLGLSKG